MGSIVRYRVSIYGSGIYKEAVLDEDKGLSIGTRKECQIRFDKSKFFGDFKLSIEKENDKYFVYCGDGLFIKSEDGTKEHFHILEPGDHLAVCYGNLSVDFLYLDFAVDFGNIQDNYDKSIKVPFTGSFTIGGRGNYDIAINDDKIGSSYIVFLSDSNGFTIDVSRARHEVSINGTLVRDDRISFKTGQFVSFFGYIFSILLMVF